ncbi:hypothetical protein [Vreelandella arcis]|nr:hypothetical protein [Halomonas arcis]
MKPTRSLLMVFLLPLLIILVPALILGVLALNMAREHSLDSHRTQSDYLNTLVEMTTFERRSGALHERLTQVLDEAENDQLSALNREEEYSLINQELNDIGEQIDYFTEAGLIDELSNGSAASLEHAFQEYRRLIGMAYEAVTLNQGDSAFFCAGSGS